jgi:putative ABC transport system permease protein
MLRSYLTLALRTFRRDKVYTTVNVIGLTLGMAAFLLIGLFVTDELSYDDFHEKTDRIVAVGVETRGSFPRTNQMAPYPLGGALASSVPEVEQIVRTRGDGRMQTVHRTGGGEGFEHEERVLVADPSFFEVFSFPLVKGDPSDVLGGPQRAVITEEVARTFFGEGNPLGKALTFDSRTVTVAGVSETPPANSTIQFDVVEPSTTQGNWNRTAWHTYALLSRPMEASAFTEKMRQVVAPHKINSSTTYTALPLSKLYLSDFYEVSGFAGQRRYVYLFGTIGLLILLIAAVNYVNLVTAQGEGRAKEVGVRKTVGAQREQLAGQFMGETMLLSGVSLVAALIVTGLALPAFGAFLGVDLSLSMARGGRSLLWLIGFVLVVSAAAGAYPALVLSRFRPIEVLRGRISGGAGGRSLRRGLVVFQFAVSAGLLLYTVVLYQQMHYVQTKNLGFDGEQLVTVDLSSQLGEQRQQAIKRAVLAVPGVERATAAQSVPGGFNIGSSGQTPSDLSSAAQAADTLGIFPSIVGSDYVETMGMELLAGRDFRKDRPTDRTQGYILNRAAAEAMGWTTEEAVGKPFLFGRKPGTAEGKVLGVIGNFHIESLRDPIKPVVLLMQSPMFASSPTISARLAPDRISEAMDDIEEVLAAQLPEESFEYTFLGEKFDAMYRAEMRLTTVFLVFAAVAALVACLGLFGLAAFAAERRSKEIAIRKTMGASTGDIVALVSKEFTLLVAVALVAGAPVAWWGAEQWLDGFAYHVEVGAGTLALTAMVAFLVAGAATSYHAMRAALANPAQALRDE